MRTLWLQWGGNVDLADSFGLPHLKYPLCYNIPRTAWSDDQKTIFLSFKNAFSIYVDLLIELDKTIGPSNADTTADQFIRSYRICIGKAEKASESIIDGPTVRDIVVGQYYSRFHDKSNLISKPFYTENIRTIFKNINIKINGQSFPISVENFLEYKTIHFLSKFTTLHPGDLVSLGTLMFQSELMERKFTINTSIDNWRYSVSISER